MDFSKDSLPANWRSKKRVLIFSLAYAPFVSGAELAVKEITDRIKDIDFDLITLRFNRKWPKSEKIGNVNVYRIGGGKLFFPFSAFWKARQLNKKIKYDLVWSIMANRAGFAALFFKLWHPKIKYLLTLQEGDALDYPEKRMGLAKIFIGGLFRKIFTKADCIQAISNYLADWAKKMGAKAPIEVVPNGVDTNKLKIKNEKRKTNEKTIITTSRLVYKNGVDILIRSAAELKNIIHNSLFIIQILGGGPEEKKLKDLAKELKIYDTVQFLGHIDQEKIYDYLAEADIFVRPSRTEGLGISFLEAMGAGLPIIATAVGGIPDFLGDGETGLFCKVDNPKDLADKIDRLIKDEELAKRLAENGRKLVLEKYDWNNISDKMENIFRQTLEREKLKVLICAGIYPPDIGGPATYSKLLFDELPKRGVGVKVLSFSAVRHLPKIIRHFVYFFKVLNMGKRVDVIYAQDPVSVGLPAMLAAKILRKKFILKIVGDYAWEQMQVKNEKRKTKNENAKFITLEEFQTEKYDFKTELRREIQKCVAKNASKIIVPSQYLKNIVLKWGIDENKIKVIYNAFEARDLKETKKELRKKLDLSGTILISAGRLVPWKGFDKLIEIMPEILKEIPDANLIIMGSGPEENVLKLKIKNLKLEERIFLLGQLPHNDVLKYLKAGDIFILNTGYEGFSHFLLEAMAMEIPIITTKVGGNVELIDDGENGFLAEYNDKEELKKKIIELAKNETLKKELTENAKQKAAEFGEEKMLKETVEILRQ